MDNIHKGIVKKEPSISRKHVTQEGPGVVRCLNICAQSFYSREARRSVFTIQSGFEKVLKNSTKTTMLLLFGGQT